MTGSASSAAATARTSTARSDAGPSTARLVADGFPAGIACDDGAAAVFQGTELVEVVSEIPTARGYNVSVDGEEPIATRLLR